ncbi:MAG: hypothetical protein J7497_00715 [Chitinophagaceae bacterium]|nr:hypothetical protein [Chitinophagaceae bacterium]
MPGSAIKAFFFSNYFYGVCAVALSIEASLQQQFPLNSIQYYLFSFAVTVLYYTRAYITEKPSDINPRSHWYWQNRKAVNLSQIFFTVVAVIYLSVLFFRHHRFIFQLTVHDIFLAGVFPAVALLYYGINHQQFQKLNLRNIGWLKPFIIGFVWAGLVNVYPIMFYNIENEQHYIQDLPGLFLFIKNFMFVTVLCIMFDIKDYAADHNRQLKTFVVKAGLRKTIFFILIPLCIAGLGSFLYYATARHFSLEKIGINTIPFLLLIAVAYSMHRRKSIFYYLIVIDGLMLVKAICGTIAMIYF